MASWGTRGGSAIELSFALRDMTSIVGSGAEIRRRCLRFFLSRGCAARCMYRYYINATNASQEGGGAFENRRAVSNRWWAREEDDWLFNVRPFCFDKILGYLRLNRLRLLGLDDLGVAVDGRAPTGDGEDGELILRAPGWGGRWGGRWVGGWGGEGGRVENACHAERGRRT